MSASTATRFVYVGTYTRLGQRATGSEGIYVFRMDPQTGALEPVASLGGVENPSFLAVNPALGCLYATNEVAEIGGEGGGAVSAFAIDRPTGGLSLLNRQPSGGAGPAYVSLDPAGRWVLVANYAGGSVAVLPVQADGRLGPPAATVQHFGRSVDARRQEAAHAHCIITDPAGRHVLVADLGLDRVLVYRLDPRRGTLSPHEPAWAATRPGAGPRHLAFHPNRRYLYLVNELDSTVTAYAYDGRRGVLQELQTLSTLPAGFSGANTGADLHLAPSGRFLYTSNRGHDSIAVYAVDGRTGALSAAGHVSTQGRTPRNFAIDPTGTFLLAANQDSGTIVTFRLDPATGSPVPAGQVTAVPAPVCVQFVGS